MTGKRHRRLVLKYADRLARLNDPEFDALVTKIRVHFLTSRDPIVVAVTNRDERFIAHLRLAVRDRIDRPRGDNLRVSVTDVRRERPHGWSDDVDVAYLVEFAVG